MGLPISAEQAAALVERAWRAYPITDDTMEPFARKGDHWMFVPTDTLRGDGVYALLLDGAPSVWRCQSDFKGSIRCFHDNPRYKQELHLTIAQFNEAVLGRAAAIYRSM